MIDKCHIIQLPKLSDCRGKLSFVEGKHHIPFEIQRVYYLYDVPAGSKRGAHGHKKLQQLMIPLAGSFSITLDDGINKKSFHLTKSWEGLYISPMIWRELNDFSIDAVCLVLASDYYDEKDYFRDYSQFLEATRK